MKHDKTDDSCESHFEKIKSVPNIGKFEMCYSCGTCISRCMLQRKVDSNYNPRRLIRKLSLKMMEEAFCDKTTWLCSACDICYPACPQEIHISSILLAVKKIAIEQGYQSPLKTAEVNTITCVACGLCEENCPNEAIKINQIKTVIGEKLAAVVDKNQCMGCGLCASNCRSTSIELIDTEYSSKDIMEQILT